MDTQKAFLINLGTGVYNELKNRSHLSPFFLFTKRKIFETNSGGWVIRLGRFHGYKCYAELWLDEFTGHTTRRVQFTISAYTRDSKLDEVANIATQEFGDPVSIKMDTYYRTASGMVQMPRHLTNTKFGKPIYEKYVKETEFFYGFYELDKSGLHKKELSRQILRITDFLLQIIELLREEQYNDDDVYSKIENRKKVRTHLIRERRSYLSTRRKQMDNYKCAICNFKFKDKYGTMGENFAEAHHKVPLSSDNYPRLTHIDDLITVCSNCHRMLHKMEGKLSDIEVLKKLLNR